MPIDATTGVLVTPIGLGDIAAALGVSLTEIGPLCKSESINKWAIFKPVRDAAIPAAEQTVWANENLSMHCGLTVPYADYLGGVTENDTGDHTYRYPNGFLKDITTGLAWIYLKPRGDAVTPIEPYRAADWEGYQPASVNPMPYPDSATSIVGNSFTMLGEIPEDLPLGNIKLELTNVPSDINPHAGNKDLSDFYLGFFFWQGTAPAISDCFWATAAYPINDTSTTDHRNKRKHAAFLNMESYQGTWQVTTFLSSVPLSFCEEPAQGTALFVATGIDPITVDINKPSVRGMNIAAWNCKSLSSTSVKTSITIKNNTGVTVETQTVRVVVTTHQDYPQTFSAVTLANGETYEFDHTFTGVFSADLSTTTIKISFYYYAAGDSTRYRRVEKRDLEGNIIESSDTYPIEPTP